MKAEFVVPCSMVVKESMSKRCLHHFHKIKLLVDMQDVTYVLILCLCSFQRCCLCPGL